MTRLEQLPLFRQADSFAIYHALPDEVQTADFIEKWYTKKEVLLPVIKGDDIVLQPYMGKDSLSVGSFGILEPTQQKTDIPKQKTPEIIIIPGIAFDKEYNRLGRGKGYYDRLLPHLSIPKIGLCFNFQFIRSVPSTPFDTKMDIIVTDKEIF